MDNTGRNSQDRKTLGRTFCGWMDSDLYLWWDFKLIQ